MAPAPQQTAAATPEATTPPAAAPDTDTDAVVAPSARVNLSEGQPQTAAPAAQATPAPAPAPAPMQTASAAPPPAPAPAPAPMQTASAAPPPAPVPSPAVAAPRPRPSVAAGNGALVAATYRERLDEFTTWSAAAGAASARDAYVPSAPAPAQGSVMNDGSAIPNTKVTAAHGSGGAHPLSALDASRAAARFDIAEIDFGEGTAALLPSQDASLSAVAQVYRDSKGAAKIGIIGHSNSPRLDISAAANRESNRSLAAERAAAVARALEKMGVPASKIYVGATGETAGDYAEVFAAY